MNLCGEDPQLEAAILEALTDARKRGVGEAKMEMLTEATLNKAIRQMRDESEEILDAPPHICLECGMHYVEPTRCPVNGADSPTVTIEELTEMWHKGAMEIRRLRALLEDAADEYAGHSAWRCEHPDRHPHDPVCPCGYTDWIKLARAELEAGDAK